MIDFKSWVIISILGALWGWFFVVHLMYRDCYGDSGHRPRWSAAANENAAAIRRRQEKALQLDSSRTCGGSCVARKNARFR